MPIKVDKEAKRKRLIAAASDTFARKGYHATKMQDVANDARVAKGTLYEYFAAKEDLFLAIYDEWMTEYEETTRRRFAEAEDAVGRADAARESAVEFYTRRAPQAPLLLEFWAHALRTENPAFLERIRKMFDALSGFGQIITQELVDAGVFAPVEARSITLLEAGISDGIFLLWTLAGREFSLDKAYKFRQSLLGVGLLSEEGRAVMENHLRDKLKKGFLPEQNKSVVNLNEKK